MGLGKFSFVNFMLVLLLIWVILEEVRMILIDLKMVELMLYEGILYLIMLIIIQLKKVVVVLVWLVDEMEQCYQDMQVFWVCYIDDFNDKV